MAIIKLICQSCGGLQEVDECSQFVFCVYCGTRAILSQINQIKNETGDLRKKLEADILKRKKQSIIAYILGGLILAAGTVMVVVDSIGENERTALLWVGIAIMVIGAFIAFAGWGHKLEGTDKLKSLCKECNMGMMKKHKDGEKGIPSWVCNHCQRISYFEGI